MALPITSGFSQSLTVPGGWGTLTASPQGAWKQPNAFRLLNQRYLITLGLVQDLPCQASDRDTEWKAGPGAGRRGDRGCGAGEHEEAGRQLKPWEAGSGMQAAFGGCDCSGKNVHFGIKPSLETQLPAVLALASHNMPPNLFPHLLDKDRNNSLTSYFH